jgi:cytochrome P450 PksS
MANLPQIDLADPRFKADPYPLYARLRAEAPLYRTTVRIPTRKTAWLISRYDDVAALLKDSRFVKDQARAGGPGPGWIAGPLRPMTRNMLDLDPPDHSRLRALVQKAFTPRLVEQLRVRIVELCEQLLAPSVSAGRIELVSQYALPLPMTIITELLGIPPTDRRRFHTWSSRFVSTSRPRDAVLAVPAAWMMLRYLRRLFAARRAHPADDLVTALVQAEESGDRLSADELVGMVVILLIAGHETTVNLIASGTLALLNHPEQMDRLRGSSGAMGSAVEELLRFCSPLDIATERYAAHDVEVHGQVIPRGALVLGVLGSANRDSARFERPDELDISRSPNPHLAFGQGTHYCVGAPLARLEAQIALDTLLRRLPQLRLEVPADRLRWRRSVFLRGLEELPLRVGANEQSRRVDDNVLAGAVADRVGDRLG